MLMRFPPWKVATVIIVTLLGILFSMPNYVPEKYIGWLPIKPMKLGLDLQGGASILLEIDPDDLQTNKLREVVRDVRGALGQRPLITTERPAQVVGDEVHVKPRNADTMNEAVARIRRLGEPTGALLGGANHYVVTSRPDGVITVKMTNDYLQRLRADALTNSMEAVRRRIDNSGVVEPNIQRQGENRILVEVPGIDDPAPLIDVLTQAGVLTFNLVDTQANLADYPPGETHNGRRALMNDSIGQMQVIFDEPIITGSDLQTASQSFDQSNRPNISFQLRPSGATRFGRTTTDNVGRPFAIVLDDRIVSAPNIRSPITGGSGVIDGSFTMQEAEDLAIILRSGALPAKLMVAERRVVGAGLGADSIRMGIEATIVGMVLITIFVLLTYGLLGVFALIALYVNVVMILGGLSVLGATLTLPGIAGMLLSLAMAVDANVLVFERIREEKNNGRSPVSSVETGYSQAMSTIIDANLTTLMAGGVMYFLGSGPVRGFAVTLAIGIITSMFTAVLLARWLTSLWLNAAKPKYIPI